MLPSLLINFEFCSSLHLIAIRSLNLTKGINREVPGARQREVGVCEVLAGLQPTPQLFGAGVRTGLLLHGMPVHLLHVCFKLCC